MLAAIRVTDHLVLEPLVAPVWAAVIVIALAAAVILIARRRPAQVGPRLRRVLLALRLAVVAAVAVLLLQPVILWQGQMSIPTAVAVFLDSSRSMAIADVPPPAGRPDDPPINRAEAVRRAFLASGTAYAELSGRCRLNPLAFGVSVRPIGSFAPDPADPRTDITQALAYALDEDTAIKDRRPDTRPLPDRYRLGAVVIISDGVANRARGSAEDAARQLADRGIKVHTVLVGADAPTGPIRDVSVRDVRVPPRVFLGNRPQVRAVVTALGMKGRNVRYSLLVDDKVAEGGVFYPASDNETVEVVLSGRVTQKGLARLAVVVEPVEGELVTTNNRAETAVRVEEGAIRVLYLDGRIHPEGKYLARALGEAPEIALDRRILVGGAGGPTPADIDKFDLVVLGDLPASSLDPAVIALIAERVQTGRLNLLTLGGQNSYGAGGWADTPLAKVLPVAIHTGDGQLPGPLAFRPAPAQAGHFIFAGDAATPMNFDPLPPLAGANAVGPLDASACLLAESPDGKPLLAVREFGTSRVAAFMADTTAQWVMAPAETHGADIHRRFWRQVALWAAGRDGRPHADFWVATDRPHYVLVDPDSAPVAEVTVHTAGPLSTGLATLILTGPHDEPSAVGLDRIEGEDRRAFISLYAPGLYHLTAAVVGRQDRTEFLVDEQDFESARVLADAAALERLAKAGGGTFRRLDDLASLMTELARTLPPQFEPVPRRFPLGAGRLFVAAVLVLLTAEWLIRRKWGM